MPVNPLPAIRRVVTTLDPSGTAKVWLDEEVENKAPPGFSDGVSFGLAWVTDSTPADCQTVRLRRVFVLQSSMRRAGDVS